MSTHTKASPISHFAGKDHHISGYRKVNTKYGPTHVLSTIDGDFWANAKLNRLLVEKPSVPFSLLIGHQCEFETETGNVASYYPVSIE